MNKTLDYYNQQASLYNETTFSIEFEQRRAFFLKYLPVGAHLLDLGCGSGRDSRAFLEQGYQVTAIDGSEELCKLASKNIGQSVRCQRFEALTDQCLYDGVWACASLLHLATPALKEAIHNVERALKPGGYFYASFKYGIYEGERAGRYFNDFTEEKWKDLLRYFPTLTLQELEVTTDVIPGREDVRWLNLIMRKASESEETK